MRNYWTCPACGANLDHGEQCDCGGRPAPRPKIAQAAGSSAAARWDSGLDRIAELKAIIANAQRPQNGGGTGGAGREARL